MRATRLVRIEGICSIDFERSVRETATENLKKNLVKPVGPFSQEQIDLAPIQFIGWPGRTRIEVHIWDAPFKEKTIELLKNTVYVSFGSQTEVQIIDGKTKKVISERKCFQHEHGVVR